MKSGENANHLQFENKTDQQKYFPKCQQIHEKLMPVLLLY